MADSELHVHDVHDTAAPALPPSDGPRKYACKLCRHVVFTSEELLDHAPQQQQIAMRKVRERRLWRHTVDERRSPVDAPRTNWLRVRTERRR